ncbi:unnamed protein product [Cuscuta campestris]|uniref:Reticulon-like protein n=2 Tax=Cuscuta sect. Cleistogrammica TaxID=1824901 RepID=A0A484KYH7_9ASTE|nr:hypothetical protein DM860_016406 [Cuscuta australis]VFQ67362.1 unnamed protein product [Cuscuta campestris]
MDVGRRRRKPVVEESVWERRIRLDEVKGGIKALINTSQSEEEEESENPEKTDDQDPTFAPHINDGVCQEDGKVGMGPKPSPGGIGRRKTWKSECFELNPIQIARKTRPHLTQSLDEEKFKELGLKSPSENMKPRKAKPFMDNSRNEKILESRKDFYENGNLFGIVQDFEGNGDYIDGSREISKGCLEHKSENKPTGLQITRSGEKCEEQEQEEKVITRNIAFDMVKSTPKVEGGDLDEDQWEEAQESTEVNVVNISNVSAEKKLDNGKERNFPNSSRTKPVPVSEESCRTLRPHSRMESYVDLVMWRDVSRSALVFGVGSFMIISSSYFQDSNISLISVLSYMGLVYLAVLFIFRSLIHREAIHVGETRGFVVEEDEAMRVVKMILPYINEFLLNIKSLFYGDPATTMQMAVILFVLAHCGSSITIWKMAKLGFFGVFIFPKLCSSYSSQLSAFGTSWIRRSNAFLESFAHKKAIAIGTFALVWILSSAIARIWEVFMVYVAFRYYRLLVMRGPHSIMDETDTGPKDEDSIGLNGRRITNLPNGHTKAK